MENKIAIRLLENLEKHNRLQLLNDQSEPPKISQKIKTNIEKMMDLRNIDNSIWIIGIF